MEGASKEENLPPGFRFHPTDEELITFYLTKKISEADFAARAIADVDLNKCEPWDLPGKAKMGEKDWYFFSLRDRKYPTGVRTNRATNAGYWKTTGKDKEIFNISSQMNSELVVGMKKTLVFYKGRAPRGEKTNWVMHEYRRLHSKPSFKPNNNNKDEWVVCRVFMKSSGRRKYPSNPPARASTIDMPSSFLQPDPSYFHHFGIHRTHNHLMMTNNSELGGDLLTRFAKGGQLAAAGFNLQPIQPQLNFPGGFTLSGLNLNLGAQSQQRVQLPLPHQQLATEPTSSVQMMTNCVYTEDGGGFNNVDIDVNSQAAVAPRFLLHVDDNCADLEGGYWPSY